LCYLPFIVFGTHIFFSILTFTWLHGSPWREAVWMAAHSNNKNIQLVEQRFFMSFISP